MEDNVSRTNPILRIFVFIAAVFIMCTVLALFVELGAKLLQNAIVQEQQITTENGEIENE